MVSLKRQLKPPSDRQLIPAIIDHNKGRFEFHIDTLACVKSDVHYIPDCMKILSAAGPQTAIKALHATLCSPTGTDGKCQIIGKGKEIIIKAFGLNQWTNEYNFGREPEIGYTVKRTKLANDWYHLVAVSKDDRLLPTVTEDGVWKILKSERYTTPLLRTWVPKLIEKFRIPDKAGEACLMQLRSFQCQTAMLALHDGELDQIVSAGVQSGELQIK